MTGARKRWAVLVGIDHYSNNPYINLDGAVNDAVKMYDFLTHDLQVPKSHIKLHLARQILGSSSEFSPRDPPSTAPTKRNFFESLRSIERRSSPGDFLLVHFSGHGTRRDTLRRDLKSGTGQDELLCFSDAELADIDLGKRLDELSVKGLVILVTLDCCFSGGATRLGEEFRPRYMPKDTTSGKDSCEDEPKAISQGDDGVPLKKSSNMRNAKLLQGWLYRKRQYNVLAACQEHEIAWEHQYPDGWGGLLTSSLVACYRELQDRGDSITYSTIQDALELSVKRTLYRQQPVMIGDPHRILFGSRISRKEYVVVAHILGTAGNQVDATFLLDKGESSGVENGDVYWVEHSRSTDTPSSSSKKRCVRRVDIIINSVSPFTSTATVHPAARTASGSLSSLLQIGQDRVATLKKRGRSALVRVFYNSYQSNMKHLRKHWRSQVDPAMPVHLVFSRDGFAPVGRDTAELNVMFQEGWVTICDGGMIPFEHIPPLPSDGDDLTKRLMRRLTHLCAFLTVKKHRTPACEAPLVHEHDVTLVQTLPDTWELTINNGGTRTIYVTVLNLTPLYAVSQVFPEEDGGRAIVVEPGRPWKVPIKSEIPPELAERPWKGPYTMTDILKLFISSTQIDLACFKLNNIMEAERGRFRDLRSIRRVAPWQVEDREISTSVTTPNIFDPWQYV